MRLSTRIDYIIIYAVLHPWTVLVAITISEMMIIDFEGVFGFSAKISTHKNYLPYSNPLVALTSQASRSAYRFLYATDQNKSVA